MATIIGMMTNDLPRDGAYSPDRLEDFDHFGKGDVPRDGDHPISGDHHRDGDGARGGRIFTILRNGHLILGP